MLTGRMKAPRCNCRELIFVSFWAERSELERFRRAEEHVLSVVFDCVPRLRVREDGEAVAVGYEPWNDLAKQLAAERQLAAAARMRADRLVVHAADGNRERPAARLT